MMWGLSAASSVVSSSMVTVPGPWSVARDGLHVDVRLQPCGVAQAQARALALELTALAGTAERASERRG